MLRIVVVAMVGLSLAIAAQPAAADPVDDAQAIAADPVGVAEGWRDFILAGAPILGGMAENAVRWQAEFWSGVALGYVRSAEYDANWFSGNALQYASRTTRDLCSYAGETTSWTAHAIPSIEPSIYFRTERAKLADYVFEADVECRRLDSAGLSGPYSGSMRLEGPCYTTAAYDPDANGAPRGPYLCGGYGAFTETSGSIDLDGDGLGAQQFRWRIDKAGTGGHMTILTPSQGEPAHMLDPQGEYNAARMLDFIEQHANEWGGGDQTGFAMKGVLSIARE